MVSPNLTPITTADHEHPPQQPIAEISSSENGFLRSTEMMYALFALVIGVLLFVTAV